MTYDTTNSEASGNGEASGNSETTTDSKNSGALHDDDALPGAATDSHPLHYDIRSEGNEASHLRRFG